MKQFLSSFREPISGFTHAGGVLLSIIALVLLEHYSIAHGTLWHCVASAIFGVSLILLYAASSLYHLLPLSSRGTAILRRLDHVMIFVLIAGTYTPVCLLPLHGPWGWSLFGLSWGMAFAGMFQPFFWLDAPRWFSTSIYLVMGWMVLVAFVPLVHAIPMSGIFWLAAGGLFYTGGAVIYALKRPNPFPGIFGFHEIWHFFVLAGSFCHFWAIYCYVITIA